MRRRNLLRLMAASLLPWCLSATPAQMQAVIKERFGGRVPRPGKVRLDIPPLVENGNVVPMTVSVDSPMTAQDRVLRVHVFNEKNPQPQVITVSFGPAVSKAMFSTRIKLADSQKVTAIAEMADGSLWSGDIPVVVTIAACVEETP